MEIVILSIFLFMAITSIYGMFFTIVFSTILIGGLLLFLEEIKEFFKRIIK